MNEYARLCSVQRHSCIVLRHLCYVGRHVSIQCDDTPTSSTALLLCEQAVSIQCDSTPVLCYGTSVTWADTSLFSTVSYLRVPIVLRPSHSLLLIYIGNLLYDKNLNNEQEENIRNQLCSIMYLRVPSVQDLCSELLREI